MKKVENNKIFYTKDFKNKNPLIYRSIIIYLSYIKILSIFSFMIIIIIDKLY